MNNHDAVNCTDLKKSYNGAFAVNGADFSLAAGEFMALLGPSGCGKTTTLRLIAGLEQPDSGEIFLAGQPVSGKGIFVPPNHRHVGMVFQEYALFPHMSVEQNIAYSLPRGSQARIAEMLELVGLSGLQKRFPAQLSGGQQQRVALARALAPSPDTILLDEPFSNLDAGLRVQLREEVRRIIAEAGVSAILVTHDQDEAMSMADQLGVMLRGRLAQTGSPRMVYDDPVSPEVTLFLGEANQIPGEAHGESVETALGRLPLRHTSHGAVDVFIRPENVLINAGLPTAKTATVERSSYYGSRQTVWVRLEDGMSLKISTHTLDTHAAGDTVTIGVQGRVLAFALNS